MNFRRRWLFLVLTLVSLHSWAFGTEEALRAALEKANQGETQEAIAALEKLKMDLPGDARVSLSLGLLYQSADLPDQAIAELERAMGLTPALPGYYALGLLYEAKYLQAKSAEWKRRAIGAWEEYLNQSAIDNARRRTVEKHLKLLRSEP